MEVFKRSVHSMGIPHQKLYDPFNRTLWESKFLEPEIG